MSMNIKPEDITVYTAILGRQEPLLDQQNTGGSRFVAYVDKPSHGRTWECRSPRWHLSEPRLSARAHKMFPESCVETPYSMWVDAIVEIVMEPAEIVERALAEHDLANLLHPGPQDRCVYAEAEAILQLRKAPRDLVEEQMHYYDRAGMPKNWGLSASGVTIRRHTPAVARFNAAWWLNIQSFTMRDQLSLMYCQWSLDMQSHQIALEHVGWHALPPVADPWLRIHPHRLATPT